MSIVSISSATYSTIFFVNNPIIFVHPGDKLAMVIQTLTQNASSLLTKAAQIPTKPLRCVTVDVTGTLMGYKGLLGDYYCMAAKAAGLPCPDYTRMHEGFKIAYKEMDSKYPCFGKVHNVPNRDWWRMCVQNAFCQVRILLLSG